MFEISNLGQIQHRASMLKGKDTDKPCFAQTYLVDDEHANELRMDSITHFTPSKDVSFQITLNNC
jgi:hypothetical protein